MEWIVLAVKAAIIAYTYSEILVMGGEILNGLYKFLERKIGKYPLLFKPLIDCSKCVSGQISFWSYLIFYYKIYNPVDHLACVCTAILITITIKALFKKFIEQWLLS